MSKVHIIYLFDETGLKTGKPSVADIFLDGVFQIGYNVFAREKLKDNVLGWVSTFVRNSEERVIFSTKSRRLQESDLEGRV